LTNVGSQNKEYGGDLSVGQTKNKNDFQIGYSWYRQEQDSVLASIAESDQRAPTNILQNKFYAGWKLRPNTVANFTWWYGRVLNTNLENNAALFNNWGGAPSTIATAGQQEPWLNRLQFDLIYTYWCCMGGCVSPPFSPSAQSFNYDEREFQGGNLAVLVVGGAGYIGSHAAHTLQRRGYEVIIYDNLVTGHKELAEGFELIVGDIADSAKLTKALSRCDAVMHFAAHAYVGESVENPKKYFHNNVIAALVLLNAVMESRVRKFIFSSTAAVYGNPVKSPI